MRADVAVPFSFHEEPTEDYNDQRLTKSKANLPLPIGETMGSESGNRSTSQYHSQIPAGSSAASISSTLEGSSVAFHHSTGDDKRNGPALQRKEDPGDAVERQTTTSGSPESAHRSAYSDGKKVSSKIQNNTNSNMNTNDNNSVQHSMRRSNYNMTDKGPEDLEKTVSVENAKNNQHRSEHCVGGDEEWNNSRASAATVSLLLSSLPIADNRVTGFSPHSSLPSDPQSSTAPTALPFQHSSTAFYPLLNSSSLHHPHYSSMTREPSNLPAPHSIHNTSLTMDQHHLRSSIDQKHSVSRRGEEKGSDRIGEEARQIVTKKNNRHHSRKDRSKSKSRSKSNSRIGNQQQMADNVEPDISQLYTAPLHPLPAGSPPGGVSSPPGLSSHLLPYGRSLDHVNSFHMPPHPRQHQQHKGGTMMMLDGDGLLRSAPEQSKRSRHPIPRLSSSYRLASADSDYYWEILGSGCAGPGGSGYSGGSESLRPHAHPHEHGHSLAPPPHVLPQLMDRCDTHYTNFSGTGHQAMYDECSIFQASYAGYLPAHLHPLAREIQDLSTRDLVYIAYVTERIAEKEVYSSLAYSGANWFLPEIREVEEGEKRCEVGFNWREGIILTVGGQRLALRLLNLLIRLVLLALIWLLLFVFLPHKTMEPGGVVFDPVVLVLLSAVVGGLLCRLLRIPPIVGVMWVAICWHNIPSVDYLTSGISTSLLEVASKAGLTVILAKAGYSISPAAIRPHWQQTLLLAVVPFALEGIIGSLIASALMPYHGYYSWAFLQGMLCAVGSPAVIIPAANFLKNLGYNEKADKVNGVGPLSLMISAIPIEIVLGVWCSNFILSLLFEQQTVIVAVVLAPVQLLGGGAAGVGLGYIFHFVVEILKGEAKRMPNGLYPPSHFRLTMNFAFVLYITVCFVMVMGGYKLKLAGGGCVMCVSFCATVSYIWMKPRKVRRNSNGPHTSDDRHPSRERENYSCVDTSPSRSDSSRKQKKTKKKNKEGKGEVHTEGRGRTDTRERGEDFASPAVTSSNEMIPHGHEGTVTPPLQYEGDELHMLTPEARTPHTAGATEIASEPDSARAPDPVAEEEAEDSFVVEVSRELKEQKAFIGAWLSDLWDELMMPILFSSMGANIDLRDVFNKTFFPKALALLVIGTLIRFLCIMAVQIRSPLSWRRRLVVGIGYLGKASAQASVGPLAASMMLSDGERLWGTGGTKEDVELHDRYLRYASEIKSISALYVMVMAMVASIGVVRAGVVLLELKGKKQTSLGSTRPTSSVEEALDPETAEAAAVSKLEVEVAEAESESLSKGKGGKDFTPESKNGNHRRSDG